MFLLSALPALASEGGIILGSVRDQATGEPLRKVLVSLRGTDLQAITGDDGTYRLEGVPAGDYTLYVSTIGYRLLKKQLRVKDADNQEIDFLLGQESTTISETVTVAAPLYEELEKASPSQVTLNSSELKNLAGVLIDDPLRSVQTLPGVATGDDFHAFYSVRGGSFRNNGILIDGVLTHSLVHTVSGTQDSTGSITALNGDLVESIALLPGAFSARYGDRTASYLDVVTREGSRDGFHARAAVSGSNASFIGEGPLGKSQRGSWIVSGRKSYLDYLLHKIGRESDVNLGFGDLQGKLAYDLSDKNRLGATFVWGRAHLERNPANRGVTSLIDGLNRVGVANLVWRFTPNSKVLWENRVSYIRETYENTNRDRELLASGTYSEVAVRSDASYQAGSRHRLEAGTLMRFIDYSLLDRRYNFAASRFLDYDRISPNYRQGSVYFQDRWTLVPGTLSATIGIRNESLELTDQSIWTPRAALEWRMSERNRIDAGWGIHSQFPDPLSILGRNGATGLRAEISRHAVLGYELLIGTKSRVRLELYDKEESNLLRSPNTLFRLVDNRIVFPDPAFRYDNALRGHARGAEISVQRRSANRLAGWISYAFERSRRRDLVTGEVYNSDFEQRHTANIYGSYRFTETWNLSAKARFGSGFPIPGYAERREAGYFLASERNRERIPYYNRIDVRLNKAFFLEKKKISLYVEVLNILNHENVRFDQTFGVNTTTRRLSLSQDTMFPILPIAGIVIDF